MGTGDLTAGADALPQGLRLYCIGDVHGRLDLLRSVCGAIEQDLSRNPVAQARIILLGDYIDRGPQSAGVIDMLASGALPAPAICLRGNHEAMLHAFLTDATCLDAWRHLGGIETLESYGVDIEEARRGHGYAEAQLTFSHVLPPNHRAFLENLPVSFEAGPYFFCHAGVRPGVPLSVQSEEDLLWIRNEFLQSREDFGRIVVHGHTPVRGPEILSNRINLDTGAFFSGRLACLVLEEGRSDFLT